MTPRLLPAAAVLSFALIATAACGSSTEAASVSLGVSGGVAAGSEGCLRGTTKTPTVPGRVAPGKAGSTPEIA